MVSTNDDPPEFLDEISTSSKRAKLCDSVQPCPSSSVDCLEEMVYEIFLRLPVKSLIRFRCLAKGMRRLIDSPIFIKNHSIHRSVIIERDRSLSVSVSVSDGEDYAIVLYQPRLRRLFSVDFDKDDSNPNRAKAIGLDSTFAEEGRMEIMGWCCKGIFCFMNSQCYAFWNPSNGTFRKVDGASCRLMAAMGYDCINDDYKIIGFILTEASLETSLSLEVYSLRNDSWKKIPGIKDFHAGQYDIFTTAVCIGGVIHRLWRNYAEESMSIDAFDLATETFSSLALPLEARQLQLQPSHFTDFRGRLCLTFFPGHYLGPQTIWVMENYGVESSWTKLYNFRTTRMPIGNFYFPNVKRRLLCHYKWLSWWDPQDDTYEDIEIPGLLNDQALIPELYHYDAYIYVRNLLRLDQV